MSVEIREIIVKAYLDDATTSKKDGVSSEQLQQLKEEILEECVDLISIEFKKRQDR